MAVVRTSRGNPIQIRSEAEGSLLKIGVIPGDGVGPEVIAASLAILEKVARQDGIEYTLEPFNLGGERYLATGDVLPAGRPGPAPPLRRDPAGRRRSSRALPPGVLEKGILLKLRFDFHQYVNLRPIRLYPGVADPDPRQGPRRHRHGRGPREQRRSLRRRRGLHLQGDARGSRDPDLDQHPGRASSGASVTRSRRLGRGRRGVRSTVFPKTDKPGIRPPAHPGGQDERAHVRPRPLDARVHGNFA